MTKDELIKEATEIMSPNGVLGDNQPKRLEKVVDLFLSRERRMLLELEEPLKRFQDGRIGEWRAIHEVTAIIAKLKGEGKA